MTKHKGIIVMKVFLKQTDKISMKCIVFKLFIYSQFVPYKISDKAQVLLVFYKYNL